MTSLSYRTVHNIYQYMLITATYNTTPRLALALTPLSVSVTPFNAKLAELTVGYSHSIRPKDGSILTV